MADILLPELGEGIKNATIACWHKNVGERIDKGDDVVELVTDKASFNVEAPQSGILKEIKFEQGQQAAIGSVLAIVE